MQHLRTFTSADRSLHQLCVPENRVVAAKGFPNAIPSSEKFHRAHREGTKSAAGGRQELQSLRRQGRTVERSTAGTGPAAQQSRFTAQNTAEASASSSPASECPDTPAAAIIPKPPPISYESLRNDTKTLH